MQIRWTPLAYDQLEAIKDYIALDNPTAAFEVTFKIYEQTEAQLSDQPLSARQGEHFPATHELVIPDVPYVVVYRVRGEVVEILRVRHTSQQWPPEDKNEILF